MVTIIKLIQINRSAAMHAGSHEWMNVDTQHAFQHNIIFSWLSPLLSFIRWRIIDSAIFSKVWYSCANALISHCNITHYSHIKTQHTLFKRNYLNNLTMITVTITWSQCIIQNNILCKYITIYWIIHKELLLSYIEKSVYHNTCHFIFINIIIYYIYMW